jgi:cell division protein FtsI (penicillin-binding protein 3)
VPGTGVELTIDEPLQYVTEQSLGAEILASHAKSGIAIVMNTHTGQILSMANLVSKTVQPPTPKTATPPTTAPAPAGATAAPTTTTTAPPPPPPVTTVIQAPQNLALTQVYEPGSVFKLVTFSAALQDGIISPDEVFTVPNTLTIDGWVFHDAESHPTELLNATQILAQSSNIGTIEIAQQLGEGRLAAQIATLGFGRTTGLGFPAESAGLVKSNPSTWHVSDIGSTPIGQDDAVTAQQVLDMVNTVGTGGVFVPPQLVQATVAPDGAVTKARAQATHRALTQEVASELTTMMEQVVQDGTAVTAGVPGYTVAGKTGTAQIPDPVHGGYIPGAYEATFAGFAPAENPALSAIVVLERPNPIYGGIVAAPVFSQIMRYALHRYGIPTSPGGGSTGGTPMSVPFPQVPAPKTTPANAPSPTTTTTTIVPSHGKLAERP